MRAHILLHAAHEGPGTLGAFLLAAGFRIEMVHLYRGGPLPSEPRAADLIVSMGGPMNVYDDDRHPFLAPETGYLRRAVEEGVPLLGVCLGAQLLARACGARVYRSPVKEVGWDTVRLTEEGRADRVFRDLPETMHVLQWHEDTFDLPPGGRLLATAPGCPHQAFAVDQAYGLQFHVEVDGTMLEEWFGDSPQKEAVLQEYRKVQRRFDETAARLYRSLLALAQ